MRPKNLEMQTNFIVSHVQFIYIVLPQCLSVTRAIFKFLSLVIYRTIFLNSFYFLLNLVQTSFISSHVQFIYIGFTSMFIRHTCYLLSSPLSIFTEIFFSHKFTFFETLVIQTNFIISHLQYLCIIFLAECSLVTHVKFF